MGRHLTHGSTNRAVMFGRTFALSAKMSCHGCYKRSQREKKHEDEEGKERKERRDQIGKVKKEEFKKEVREK